VASSKQKRLAHDSRDGLQSFEMCQRDLNNHDQQVRHLDGKHHRKIQFGIFELENRVLLRT
jgi:hypothetical protein